VTAAGLIEFPIDTWPEVIALAIVCATIAFVVYAVARWADF
jgi:hypothetical protein